jgi:hypothetical protein
VEAEPDFIRIETERLCAAALAEVAQHVRSARQQPVHWLWALVALKLALQTFIVASFGSAALLEAITPKLASRFLRVLKGGGQYPPQRMRDLPDLYAYAKKRHNWRPEANVDEAVDRLGEPRNNFEHFLPGAWSIEVELPPSVIGDVLTATREVGWARRALPWHDEDCKRECENLLAEIEAELGS